MAPAPCPMGHSNHIPHCPTQLTRRHLTPDHEKATPAAASHHGSRRRGLPCRGLVRSLGACGLHHLGNEADRESEEEGDAIDDGHDCVGIDLVVTRGFLGLEELRAGRRGPIGDGIQVVAEVVDCAAQGWRRRSPVRRRLGQRRPAQQGTRRGGGAACR